MRLVYLALGWCAGIVIAADVATRRVPRHPLEWTLIAIIALIALIMFTRSRLWTQKTPRMIALALFALALGGMRFSLTPATSEIAAFNNRGGMTITGTVAAPPMLRDTRADIRLNAQTLTRTGETLPTSGLILVRAARHTDVNVGDRIAVTGELIAPPTLDDFSYADYLARGGVYSLLINADVELVSPAPVGDFWRILADVRAHTRDVIASAIPEPAAGLLTGILLGDESGISPDLEADFAATGAAHIVAISGFNMIVISSIVIGMLSRLNLPKRRAAIIALIIIGIYTIFVGASAAVTRAALMSGLLIVGRSIRRKTFVPASLAFAAILLSALNPLTLWDVGFQLSMGAVFSIALLADPLSRRFDRLLKRLSSRHADRLAAWLNEPIVVSLAAMLGTLPITMLYFGRVSLVALAVNLLIVPVQPMVLALGGLASLTGLIAPAIAAPIFACVLVLLGWTITAVRTFADIPLAQIDLPLHPNLAAGFFGVLFFAAAVRAEKPAWIGRVWAFIVRRKLVTIFVSLLTVGIILGVAHLRALPDGRLHVWFLDMGHSHAALIQTPDGAHILIDGGRAPSRLLTALGDRLPFTKRSIEIVILTQPDPNEYAALIDVVARYRIGALITNGQPNISADFQSLITRLTEQGTQITPAARGWRFDLPDGTRLEALHPDPVAMPELDDRFDPNTLMLRVTYGGVSFLFTGDANDDAQAAILAAGINPAATVMGVPRHGASGALDPDFLQAVAPQVAILQSDPANRFGDPDPNTLDLLGDIRLYRTDYDGTIHLVTDGVNLEITPEG